jgi:hypothetical protein
MATTVLVVFSRLQHRPPPLTRALRRAVVKKRYPSRAPPALTAIATSSDPDAPTSELSELQVPAELGFSLQRLLPTGEHAIVLPLPLFPPASLEFEPSLLLTKGLEADLTPELKPSHLPEQLALSRPSIRFSPSSWRRNFEQATGRSMAPWR